MNHKQEKMRQEALQLTGMLFEEYFVQRDFNVISTYMSEKISWFGTGENDISRNLDEAKQLLEGELIEYDGAFAIKETWLEIAACSDTLCVVYGMLHAIPEDSALSEEDMRLTLVLEKTPKGLKLLHLHLSAPDRDQEKGHYFVPKTVRNATATLKRTLDLRDRQLDILNHNIPGGAHQCKNDPNLTLLSMSDSFLSMFGYTREEVATIFHDRFIEMVYPGDRAALLATLNEQLEHGCDIEAEYRVMCKNGTPVWIMDKGRLLDDGNGGENFYCLLIEIAERRRAQEELQLSLERYQIITDQATDIIFEWDIQQDKLTFSPNWRKKFGYEAINNQISARIPLSENIHPDDVGAFVQIMKDTVAGVPYSETEFRIQDVTGRYFWCRIRATAQFDQDGRAIKAVGVILDIDNEKRQKQELLEMAQKDALTGLYNKATINTLVERRMQGQYLNGVQALFILDVDNFKQVNDTYGHLAGDSLLSNVATAIKSQLRATDLAGRIGGDEFLVYLPEVASASAAKEKADRLLKALALLTPETGAAPISCSIGVATFPCGKMDYQALYKCADLALYARKNNGRRGVTFYEPDMNGYLSHNELTSAVGTPVGSDDANVADEQLAQYAFRMLYSAKDLKSALNLLLEIIGRSYDVSRAYIFESSEDGKRCSNTFEWCAEGIEPQIEVLQDISYIEDLGDYQKNFDVRGIFYCGGIDETHPDVRAILEPQGIYSMLQCAILDEGEFAGYVGFDECRDNRVWTPQQAASFKLTADVLASFLLKMRQKEKLKKWYGKTK